MHTPIHPPLETPASSTVRASCVGLSPRSHQKLKREGETICQEKGTLVYKKRHGKRDVNILSTNFEPKTEKERRKRNGDDAHVKKPACLDMYNDNIGGVNRSDKLHLSTPLLNPPKSGTSICFGLFFSSLLLIRLKFS